MIDVCVKRMITINGINGQKIKEGLIVNGEV